MDGSMSPAPVREQATMVTTSNRVVILGALSAIAIATARIYAAEGASLLLVARNEERLKGLADDLRARGAAKVEIATLDLEAGASKAKQHLDTWSKALGGIDHVHVIYGYLGAQDKASSDPAELARILSSNFSSAILWCEAAAGIIRLRATAAGSRTMRMAPPRAALRSTCRASPTPSPRWADARWR